MGVIQKGDSRVSDAQTALIVKWPDIESNGPGGPFASRLGETGIRTIPCCRSDLLVQRIVHCPEPPDVNAPPGFDEYIDLQLSAADGLVAGTALVMLSLYGELLAPEPWRHRKSGFLVEAPDRSDLSESDLIWFDDNFERTSDITVEESTSNLRELAQFLKSEGMTLLIWNVSTFDPTQPSANGPSEYRVRSNLLISKVERLAVEHGFEIVDVDSAVAELGANSHVVGPGLLSAEAMDYVTEEALKAIDRSGSLGKISLDPVMRVTVPRYDRRTTSGTLVEWLAKPGSWLADGEKMFRVQFDVLPFHFDRSPDDRRRKKRARKRQGRSATITIDALAGAGAYLAEILEPVGSLVEVGQTVALATSEAVAGPVVEADATGTLRLGVKVAAR